ncbi:MAG TPA: hypothetical protein VGV61_17775 [Thermoanaerobaculia bacterium]|jgi:hypothetical protein|nr:hypothetical protein [Thermoanaerobaculia bacterium]
MNELELASALRRRSVEPHPAEETWERFATGELSPAERERLLDHALLCGECARALRGVLALGDLRRPQRRWRPLWVGVGLAAAATIVALVAIRPDLGRPARHDRQVRGTESATVAILEPRGSLGTPPGFFRWRRVPRATSYRLRLFSDEGVPLANVDRIAAAELASDKLGVELRPGRYVWKVEALHPPAMLASSRLVGFEIRP